MKYILQWLSLGKRIRPKDKNLVRDFAVNRLVLAYLLFFFLLNFKSLVTFPYGRLSLFNLDTSLLSEYFNGGYVALTLLLSAIFCAGLTVLFFVFGKGQLKQLQHRQALARMLIDNKWYASEKDSGTGFFTVSKPKEKITDFPSLYYKMDGSHIVITLKATMNNAQLQLMKLYERVESGLFCEYVSRTENEPYYSFMFYHDLEKNRLDIGSIKSEDGKLELMKGFAWDMDKLPHALVVGGTGSGKSYFLLTLVKALLDSGADLSVIDPKNADLADLKTILPKVYSDPAGIVSCLQSYRDAMMARSGSMKQMSGYRMGGNYRDLGLSPHFLIFDEYVAFMNMIDKGPERKTVDECMKQIAMLGRQTGFFIILACQRPDATYFSDGMRDQFHFRVALGRNSELGYHMVFGDINKLFFDMPAGRGYVDTGTNVISKFFAPLVPKGYDFYGEIAKAYRRT